ncbi:uncharacterized protein [Solanum tuberosum]|uniref:uncharacterized protein isoform X4 n=1 Tax=Solanum tuberosum TaxID=4113 RepID=UPI000739FC34|nr:PREDICTED: uncharacterized protein LOC102581370 isoform X4 [Solanum tuberosum]
MTEKMEVTEKVCATEEVVQALLECMVEPLLGHSSCKSKKVPTLDQQKSMAKQVGAVVLLYNYYYRKQHQDQKIEFLNFASFCQLAVVLKPTLMTYVKLMHRSDYTDVDNLESQLSLTEKEIMRACDISSTLDAAEVVPLSQKWPTSKVAVFLVDSRRENCLLMHSSMTCAVWSIIEKHLDVSSSYLFDSKCISKKKKANMFSTGLHYADESSLQDLALSAATEATGINRSDLVVLESHLVYSLDKEKASARLYLVQSTKLVNEGFTIPIRDIIESLQGPLIKKKSCEWSVTPAVEYFHLLPYREILLNWHSSSHHRERLSSGLQDLHVEVVAVHAYDVHVGGSSSEKEVNQHYQLRILEDEIALCNKTIQTELNGGENEALIDGCNDMCIEDEDSTNQLVEDSCTIQYSNGKRLSEAILTLQNQCQQLDQLCCSNNWVLPTYQVFPLEGGFLAKVIVKAADSKVISKSKICESPRKARESAAAHMISSFQK